jgi:hypothetical protein
MMLGMLERRLLHFFDEWRQGVTYMIGGVFLLSYLLFPRDLFTEKE